MLARWIFAILAPVDQATARRTTVVLGPLALQPLHFLAPLVLAAVGTLVGCGALLVGASRPTQVAWTCTRSVDRFVCDERRNGVFVARFEGVEPQERVIQGRDYQRCVLLGARMTCGGDADVAPARMRALAPGASLTIDLTRSRSVMPFLVALLAGGAFVAMAAYWAWLALGRGRTCKITITPRTLDKQGGASIPRMHGEQVRVVRVSGGRGQYPVWAVHYGDATTGTLLASWVSFAGPRELEPFAGALRRALASLPIG